MVCLVEHNLSPKCPPWCEWEQDDYRGPSFPEINSSSCLDAFLDMGSGFEPRDAYLRRERVLCEAGGGAFPCYTHGHGIRVERVALAFLRTC